MLREPANTWKWSEIAAHEPGSILLERAFTRACMGQSLLFRNPVKVIEARDTAEIRERFAEIETALSQGFWVAGYISYEAGYAFEPSLVDLCRRCPNNAPLLWLGCYQVPEIREESCVRSVSTLVTPHVDLQYSLAADAYACKVEKIRDFIARGDTYQANLTMDVRWSTDEDPSHMYERLLQAQPVRYAALLHPERGWRLLSLSPELFFARDGDRIVTQPMKGTASHGLDAAESRENAAWLRADEKNRAENLMIVDLLRNDLGRICQVDSIRVDKLFEVERYPTVLQMTSTIEGRLRENIAYAELFGALFPSGSIVGAPKIHTMRLLREIEGRPRGVYTGAIGYMAPGGVAEFSVAIRTISLRAGRAHLGVGSGIVYDSSPAPEYEECKTKTNFLTYQPEQDFRLIETLRLEGNRYVLLEEHLERMRQSAEYFDMTFDAARVQLALEAAAEASNALSRARVRLLLDSYGSVTWSVAPLNTSDDDGLAILLSTERTDPTDRFLRHKTTHRSLYDNALSFAREKGYADVLFRNVRDEITECAIHNVVVSSAGRLFTPPLAAGVLPGVYRGRMLRDGRVSEQVLSKGDLIQAEAVYVCNSVNGLRNVIRIEEQRDGSGEHSLIWAASSAGGEAK